MAAARALGFLGRRTERAALDRLLTDVRDGGSRALLIRGEAGIGKTALLHYCAREASGFRVKRVASVECEMELAYAGLHQLCASMLDRRDGLARPQRAALDVALGLSSGDAPDPFLVGLAVLSLLSDVARDRPLLCLVDDAHWLDAESRRLIGFVSRRLMAESVAIVVAARDSGDRRGLEGVPDLALGGLDRDSARALLERVVPGRLDERVRDRLVAESRGNPLALLELPRSMTALELAGGFPFVVSADVPSHVEADYLQRAAELPAATQRLLMLLAAEPTGDTTVVWRAAEWLGVNTAALAPAEEVHLIEIAERVRFCHPLARSAVYRAAPPAERRLAHEALAAVSDSKTDSDRHAWHRALASEGPDEAVAAELEHAAERAQTRGGVAATAGFLERAAALSVDPGGQARRALAAARAKHQAGESPAALALLAVAEAGALDELGRAQADLLQAQITFSSNRGSDAPPLMLKAAKQLEPLDVTLARETYLEALMAAQFAGRASNGAEIAVAEAARRAPPARSPRAPDLLLDGMAVMILEGHAAAAPLLRQAVHAFRTGDIGANGGFRWLWLAMEAAQEVWDHDAWHELAMLALRLIREAGALTMLPLGLHGSICAQIFAGELAAAAAEIEDQQIAIEATGIRLAPYGALILMAWRGHEAELSALVDATLEEIVPRGEDIGVSTCQWVTAVLRNGLAQYERAFISAREVLDPPRKMDWTMRATLPELVEAAARTGRMQEAAEAIEELSATTRPSDSEWGLGLEARSRALVADGDDAEPLYLEAIERLGRTAVRPDHARAHLLYGEWLRREGRRSDARVQLHAAHEMFSIMGMEAFAGRARRELAATGERVPQRRPETRDELTAQEAQIARLAADGLSNPEIGGRLFLSPRTVEWHLHKVFAKLAIRSRRELREALRAQLTEPGT